MSNDWWEVEDFEHKGFLIEIEYDQWRESPRTWQDNCGEMLYGHRRYILGDRRVDSREELDEIEDDPSEVWLPLYIYDHSGVTMNTTGFSCPWDSGRVGLIHASIEDGRKWGYSGTDDEVREKIERCLEAEVEEFDQYLRGEVYVLRVSRLIEIDDSVTDYDVEISYRKYGHDRLFTKGEEIECYGNIFADMDYLRKEWRSIAENQFERDVENGVPVIKLTAQEV